MFLICFHFLTNFNLVALINRSNPPKVFLGKGALKICNKSTGEHSCRSVILVKLLKQLYWNHNSVWVFSCKFEVYFHYTCLKEHLSRATYVEKAGKKKSLKMESFKPNIHGEGQFSEVYLELSLFKAGRKGIGASIKRY